MTGEMRKLTEDEIRERIARLPKRVAEVRERAPDIEAIIEEALRSNMQLSHSEIFQFAVRYASENYRDFYDFLKRNYREDITKAEYVSPGAISLAAERNLACAAIGIGAVWIWVIVAPWTTEVQ